MYSTLALLELGNTKFHPNLCTLLGQAGLILSCEHAQEWRNVHSYCSTDQVYTMQLYWQTHMHRTSFEVVEMYIQ